MIATQSSQRQIIAAFDFDGTITKRDSLFSFLLYCAGTWTALCKMSRLTPQVLAYLSNNIISRQQMKEHFLSSFFSGMPIDQLSKLGESFSRSIALQNLIRPTALQRLKWHIQQNHRCVLVSATLDIYLKPWGEQAGFDEIICSNLAVSSAGTVTGKLQGLNCWGPEKVDRLFKRYGPCENYLLYAYGDSLGDKELLAISDYPFYRYF
jgi:phosphatidylglycerophosphatase C